MKSKRVLEIELMKAIAIISMVYVHTLEGSWGHFTNADSGPGYVAFYLIEFLAGFPSAAAFMFAMGWGAAYSDRATPQTYIRRLYTLALLGVLVNIFEEFVPGIVDPENYGPVSEFLYAILAVDIYYFAALYMLIFALLRRLFDNERARVIISVGFIVVILALNTILTP